MKRILTALALASITATASAQWVEIATGENGTVYLMREGTQARSQTRAGEPITAVTGSMRDRNGAQSFWRWYVRDTDCDRRIGRLTTLRASGEFAWHSDWAEGGGTVASELARVICNVRVLLDRSDVAPAPAPAPPAAWTPAGRL